MSIPEQPIAGKSPAQVPSRRRLRWYLLGLCVAGLIAGTWFWLTRSPGGVLPPGQPPFDPRPAMARLESRLTTDKFRFAFISDGHSSAGFHQLAKYVDSVLQPDFVVTGGDIISSGVEENGLYYWRQLANVDGDLMRRRPWWPVTGNHEVLVGGSPREEDSLECSSEQWQRFYGLPSDRYAFSLRNARFIVLPFHNIPEVQPWLERELQSAAGTSQHIFVFRHVPLFTNGAKSRQEIPNTATPVTELFSKHGVRAVFSGHDHGYYRTLRDRVTYVVAGGAGASLYAANRRDEGLPGDVWCRAEPDEKKSKRGTFKVMIYNGANGGKTRIVDEISPFAVLVEVDGPKVRLSCLTLDNEVIDTAELAADAIVPAQPALP